MKMSEEYYSVNCIVINVFGRFVKELDLADPYFADFRPYSANIIYFGYTPFLDFGSMYESTKFGKIGVFIFQLFEANYMTRRK